MCSHLSAHHFHSLKSFLSSFGPVWDSSHPAQSGRRNSSPPPPPLLLLLVLKPVCHVAERFYKFVPRVRLCSEASMREQKEKKKKKCETSICLTVRLCCLARMKLFHKNTQKNYFFCFQTPGDPFITPHLDNTLEIMTETSTVSLLLPKTLFDRHLLSYSKSYLAAS